MMRPEQEDHAMTDSSRLRPEIETTQAHPGRMYDYLLGGTANFEADRVAIEASSGAVGGIDHAKATVRSNRAFLVRAVRWLASEAGVRQFLDLGTGIPTAPNVADVARDVAPDCRVVYVDNDPVMLAHAHRLLRGSTEGATHYIWADIRDPDEVLQQAAATLDFNEPLAVLLVAVTHSLPDDEPHRIISHIADRIPTGSYLAVSQLTTDIMPEATTALRDKWEKDDTIREPFVFRDRDQFATFFDGWELIDPGVVALDDWRPDGHAPPRPEGWDTPHYAAVATKPAQRPQDTP